MEKEGLSAEMAENAEIGYRRIGDGRLRMEEVDGRR